VTFKHKDTKVINRDDIQLTEEQDRLTKLGIPIISGVRSTAKQESLKDHQGPNGQWYTAGGMPVAEHSLHTTGAAIDCGPLNKAQRKILAENGWYQPIPQQDPNHWEKINPT
jgi:LAS superfamily LD-carboxypeptidase LdcB